MASSEPGLQLIAALALTALVLGMIALAKRARRAGGNRHLWGTVFESLTHYIQPQDVLKMPQQEVRIRNKRLTGDDEDKNDSGISKQTR